jgi:hypothetical protein
MSLRKNLLCACSMLLLAVSAQAEVQALPAESSPVSSDSAAVAPSATGNDIAYRPLTGDDRLRIYWRRAFYSPGAFFRAAGPALGSHLRNEPPQWGQGARGYGRRSADRFGRFALKETYEAAGAAALGHEVRYIRSSRTGFLPRAGHALAATFVTKDRHGRRTPHVARVGSVFAAEFTGNLWMPAGHRTRSEAIRGVGIELGVSSMFNLIREFSPELRRVLFWK